MKPWMMDICTPDGTKLHGAGLQYSEGWWKVRVGGNKGQSRMLISSWVTAPARMLLMLWKPLLINGSSSARHSSSAQALAGMLTGRGLIASITKAPPGQRAFAVVTCTDKVGLCLGRLIGSGRRGGCSPLRFCFACSGAAGALSSCARPSSAPSLPCPAQGAAFLRSQEPLVLQLSGELAQQVGGRGRGLVVLHSCIVRLQACM